MTDSKQPLLQVRNLVKHFPVGERKIVRAVDGVTFNLYPGETLSIVGESGCGKSTLGRAVVRIHEPTAGEVLFEGQNILHLDLKRMRAMRSRMQFIFQDPYASLDSRRIRDCWRWQ